MVNTLNEAQRRWYVGCMSQAKGGYSDRELSRITGLDVKTIRRGRREIASESAAQMGSRVRRAGVDVNAPKKSGWLGRYAAVHCRASYSR